MVKERLSGDTALVGVFHTAAGLGTRSLSHALRNLPYWRDRLRTTKKDIDSRSRFNWVAGSGIRRPLPSLSTLTPEEGECRKENKEKERKQREKGDRAEKYPSTGSYNRPAEANMDSFTQGTLFTKSTAFVGIFSSWETCSESLSTVQCPDREHSVNYLTASHLPHLSNRMRTIRRSCSS